MLSIGRDWPTRYFKLFLKHAPCMQAGNAFVSMRRLAQFLLQEERKDDGTTLDHLGVKITDGNFYWASSAKDPSTLPSKTKKEKKAARKAAKIAAKEAAKNPTKPVAAQPSAAAGEATAEAVVVRLPTDTETIHGRRAEAGKGVLETDMSSEASSETGKAKAAERSDLRTAGAGEEQDSVWWLRDVNFEVKQGELVCVVGAWEFYVLKGRGVANSCLF